MRGWVSHLLLMALFLRALIPSGFMPSFGGPDGMVSVVICSAAGSKLVTLDADGKPIPDKPAKHSTELCAFASHAAIGAPVVAGNLLATGDYGAAAPFIPRVVILPPTRAGPAVGSRAPPQVS